MGKTKGLYNAEFPVGTRVLIASHELLENFMRTWRYHHPLATEQLHFADKTARVEKAFFYHGGDELYQLEGIPGVWHESCLMTAEG